jgi:hypothetical protein
MAPRDSTPRPLTGIILALFAAGALLGDVLLLGRLVLDVESFTSAERTGMLSLSLFHLEGVETAFLLGFAVSLIAMACGGFLWLTDGHPANRTEAGWTLTGTILALILFVSLVLMFLLDSTGIRAGLLLVAFVVSSALLVYLVVSFIRAAFEK